MRPSTQGYSLVDVNSRPGQLALDQQAQTLGDVLLCPIQPGQEHAPFAIQRVDDHLAGVQLQHQSGLDQLGRHLEQLACQHGQLCDRQAAVPFAGRLGQCKRDAGAHAHAGGGLDAELACDQVCGAEADAAYIAGQAVGVVGDDLHGLGAVGLVDAHRPAGAHAVGMQEQHDLADHLLLGPAGDDACGALGPDAGHLAQPGRLLLDQLEHRRPERPHQLGGVDRADAADHAGAEVLLDAFQGGGRACPEERGLELQAVGAVVEPGAAHLQPLAGGDGGGVADDGHEVALAAHLDPQHAEARVGVVERHPLDQAGQSLDGRAGHVDGSIGQGRHHAIKLFARLIMAECRDPGQT